MRPPRIPRPIPELVQALDGHVRLLKSYYVPAFQQSDLDYLGEVAGKLRVLIYEHSRSRNTPLLLGLMDELGVEIRFTLNGPPATTTRAPISLREYLDLTAYAIRTPSRGLVELTNKQLIGVWSQQHGAAHEDWDLDEEFVLMRDCGVYLGGQAAIAASLRVITNTVLHVADEFLNRAEIKAMLTLP